MAEEGEARRLAAIMLTDIVGYTALAQENEPLALELLEEHNRLLRPLFQGFGGREIKSTGDGFLVEFPSALEATRCAIEIQKALQDRNAAASPGRRIEVRIGLHVGDVLHREGDVFGDGVNIASRIEPLAPPGGICLTRQVYDHVWNKIDLPLVSLGKKELKNVQLPMEVYRVVLPWEEVPHRGDQPLDRSRIAVLPLANISPDPKDEYFADGMTEELIYTLSKIGGLHVIAHTSVMQYKGAPKSVTEIGRELRVGTVIEGSVRKAGNKLRITVQLIDVESQAHLWSQRYDRELEDVFAIQSEIAEEVAEALEVRLMVEERRLVEKERAGSPEAYILYLKGRYFLNRFTEEGLRKAIEYFEQALAQDPDYAAAYAGIADAYTFLMEWGLVQPQEAYSKAKEAAEKALELDETLAEAHASLALIQLVFEDDIEAGERELRRALELNPNHAPAHLYYAHVLLAQGRIEEALAESRKALELDPLFPFSHIGVGRMLQNMGDLDGAMEQYHRALEIDPSFIIARFELVRAKQIAGDWPGAEAEIGKALELDPDNLWAHILRAYHLMFIGRTEEGLAELERVLELDPDFARRSVEVGDLLYFARRYDRAIEQLSRRLAMVPKDGQAHLYIGQAYIWRSMYEEAQAAFQEARAAFGGLHRQLDLWATAGLGIAYARMGKRDEALKVLQDLMGRPEQPDRASAIARLCFHLGEVERGFGWLEKAYEHRDPWLRTLKAQPDFDGVRSDPRFIALLKRMGLGD